MTFNKVNTSGWAVQAELTSTQINALDSDHAKAIDKTGDGYATNGGISGTVDVLSGGHLRLVNSSGMALVDLTGTTLTVNSGGALTTTSGTTTTIGGTLSVSGLLNLTNGLTTSSTVTLNSGASLTASSGSSINAASGSTTSLKGKTYVNVKTTTVGYTVDSSQSDTVILADTSGGSPLTVTLPSIGGLAGRCITIKDFGGQAGTHAITVSAGAGQTIEGNASVNLSGNYGWITVVSTAGTAWYIISADKNMVP